MKITILEDDIDIRELMEKPAINLFILKRFLIVVHIWKYIYRIYWF